MSRNESGHRRDEPGLGPKPWSNERLSAGVNLTKPDESQRDLRTHMELWVTMPNVNLGKLVPFVVHDRLGNAKITKTYFLMS